MKCVSLVWIEKRREALEIGVQLDEKKGLIQRDTRGLGVSTKTPLLESQVLDSKSSVSVGSSPWTPPSLPPGASPPLRFTDSSHPFIRIHPSERRNRPCCPPPKPRNLSSFHSWVRLIAGLELRKGVWVVGVANDEIGLQRHHTTVPIKLLQHHEESQYFSALGSWVLGFGGFEDLGAWVLLGLGCR